MTPEEAARDHWCELLGGFIPSEVRAHLNTLTPAEVDKWIDDVSPAVLREFKLDCVGALVIKLEEEDSYV